ncbi:MAG: hypothetical protein JNK82_22485 [Myxococcaceae bacterium]|nr:hypothetical protein [Myxococcaceae bacterium]
MIFTRASSLPAANVLPRVAQWFQANGYDLVAKSPHEMSLYQKAGNAHRLSVKSDGRTVTFDFGLETDAGELERRVNASMAGIVGGPAPSAAKRCPACSTMAEPGASECAVCGSSL